MKAGGIEGGGEPQPPQKTSELMGARGKLPPKGTYPITGKKKEKRSKNYGAVTAEGKKLKEVVK